VHIGSYPEGRSSPLDILFSESQPLSQLDRKDNQTNLESGTTIGGRPDPGIPGDLEKNICRFIDEPQLAEDMSLDSKQAGKQFLTEGIVDQYIDIYYRVIR